jgi:beta-lactamase regulating signal transducer with metallopeptidase domain
VRTGQILVQVLAWVWLAGALVLTLQIAAAHFGLCRIVRFQRALTHGTALGVLEDCRSRMRIGTLLGVVLTDRVQTPALLGFIRPRLLMPAGLSRHVTLQDLRHVFMHELSHLRRQDVAVGWLVSLCQVLHWFNPLVWLAFHQMRLDREMACDALAMSYAREGEDARDYGLTLIRMQEVLGRPRPFASLAAICEGRSQLKARMERIAGFSRSTPGWPAAVPAAVLAVLLAVTGLTDATATQVRALAVAGVDRSAGQAATPVSAAAGEADTLRPAAGTAGGGDEAEDLVLMADLLESGLPRDGTAPVLPYGPVYLHYGLDGVQARQVMDSGPAGHHGLVHGDPRPATGVEDGALSFDGLDDFITVSTLPSDAFTVSLWVKPDQSAPAECRSVLTFVSSSAQLEVCTDGLSRLEWRVQAGGGNTRSFFGMQSVQSDRGAWSHVAVTCDQGRIGLYLDGVRMDHQDIVWTSAVQFLNIGGGSYGSWRGLIDEIVIYTEVLSSQRIQQIVSAVKPVPPGTSGLASSRQEVWQQGEGGFGPSPEVRQAVARSTLMQLGTAVEIITGQWAPKVCGGNWRQADAMLTPLRMLSGQLHAVTDVRDAGDRAGTNGPSPLLPYSVAQAVGLLSGAGGSGDSAEADVNEMADLVDGIVRAVVTRDGVGLQTRCSRLRQAYGHLLTTLGLDRDPTFQTQLQPQPSGQFNWSVPRVPPVRVRGRTRGR